MSKTNTECIYTVLECIYKNKTLKKEQCQAEKREILLLLFHFLLFHKLQRLIPLPKQTFILNNEIGEKSLFPRTQKGCHFFFFDKVRSGVWMGVGEVGMVGVQWTRVYEDGEFVFRYFFLQRSQTDGQPGTVKLMRRRRWWKRRKAGN